MSNILSKIINEEIDKIDSGIQELQNLIRSGVQAKNNILTPDGKNVYVIRACSKGEYDFVMQGGISGKFWGSRKSYQNEYYLIRQSIGRGISWESNMDFRETLSNWPDEPRVEYPNPKFRKPSRLIDIFQEVGTASYLTDIDYILDKRGEIVYSK